MRSSRSGEGIRHRRLRGQGLVPAIGPSGGRNRCRHRKSGKTVGASLNTVIGERNRKEESSLTVISEAVGELTESLQILIAQQRDTMTKVQYENERLGEPIMRMIGSIQFQDVVKQRLEALNRCSDHISEVIATTDADVAASTSLAEMNGLVQSHLEQTVTSAIAELKGSRDFTAQGQTGGTSIEMF